MPDFSDTDRDPFWDPPEPQLLGQSYLNLQNLTYTLDQDAEVQIFTTNTSIQGGIAGKLKVAYWPCDITGEGEPEDDLIVDDPEEIKGKEIFFRIEVTSAENLPKDLCKDVYVTYHMKHEPSVINKVPDFEGKTQNPTFNYKKVHRIECINEYIFEYLSNGSIVFKTWGSPDYNTKMLSPPPRRTSKYAASAPDQA